MSKSVNENETSKKGISSFDILKVLGALAFIVPLFLGYCQYGQSVQQNLDNNFREIVSKLSSDKKEERLAGATNLSTFIKKGNYYYWEAIDILINAVSIELDYNVLNAISGSLKKTDPEDYKVVMQKLLDLDRNSYIYSVTETMWNDTKRYDSISIHQEMISNFNSLFLGLTEDFKIENLKFKQSLFDKNILWGIKLWQAEIKSSGFYGCLIQETDFNGSKIINTVFTNSTLSECNFLQDSIESSLFINSCYLEKVVFKGTTFNDVFFTGSDIGKADFTATIGLKPIYFYEAINWEKAKFDEKFKRELVSSLINMNDDDFIQYIEQSSLTNQDIQELKESLVQ